MANFGPVTVPPPLDKLLPYAKFLVAVAAVAATVVISTVAGPPAWAYVIVSAVSALGVFTVPNDTVRAVLVDGKRAVEAGDAALAAARDGNFSTAGSDVTIAMQAVGDGVKGVEEIVQDVKNAAK